MAEDHDAAVLVPAHMRVSMYDNDLASKPVVILDTECTNAGLQARKSPIPLVQNVPGNLALSWK